MKGFLSKTLCPGDSSLVSWLFLRVLALVYISAFLSFAGQIKGLVGSDGLLPLVDQLNSIRMAIGIAGVLQYPTIFWLNASDTALSGVCWFGAGAAGFLLFDKFSRLSLIICFVLYLSVVNAGQTFTNFQWDSLLLEIGFLAIFVVNGSRITVFLFRWLLFRFMLMGGVVKLASGDQNWWNLTALKYHFETQPLPSPVAWYAHQLPLWFHKLSVAGVFFIELIVPFMIFMPRALRVFAACCFFLLQFSIILTGNYNFFNLLVIILCLFLFEDRDVIGFLGPVWSNRIMRRCLLPGRFSEAASGGLAAVIILSCSGMWWMTNVEKPLFQPVAALVSVTSAFQIANLYGPFAIMTTERLEIQVEGSRGDDIWVRYEFKYKPGNETGPLNWNIPHQPRLDWQMWFAALALPDTPYWLDRLQRKLLQGSPEVLGLFAGNPFLDAPPRQVRLSYYRYRFADSLNKTVWEREYLGSGKPIGETD